MTRGPYGAQHLEPRPRVVDPDKFAEALHSAGHTYRSLATLLELPKSTLYSIAKGQSRVSPAWAARAEEALGVPRGSLFAPTVSTTPDSPAGDPDAPSNPTSGQG